MMRFIFGPVELSFVAVKHVGVRRIVSLHIGQIQVCIFIHIQFGKLIQIQAHFDLH